MATLKLRRGSSFTSPQISEPFFNTINKTMLVGYGTAIGEQITLVKLGANTGSIQITGDLTASNITLTGDLSARNVNLSGNIIIGDEIADNIIVQAAFSGSLIPSASNAYDVGTTTKKWKNLFVVSASIDDVTLPGSNILSSSQQISDYTKFLEIQGDNVVSGSIQVDHDATTNFVSNEHINHTQVSIFAGSGMSGGGNIAGNRTITLSTGSAHFLEGVKKKINTEDVVSGSIQVDHDATTNFVSNEHIDHTSVSITAGEGLTGGGTIASTRTINIVTANDGIDINSNNIQLVNTSSTFTNGVKAKLNTETVISGSVQVNADNVTNFDTNVKDKLNVEDVISGSSQVILNDADYTGFDTNDISEGSTNLYYTDTRVKTKLNAETVISGSTQVNANTITNFDTNVKDKLNVEDVISGSLQITSLPSVDTNDLAEGSTNLYYTDTRVKTKLNAETVISGSSQVNANNVTNFDANVKDKLNVEDVISGSLQITSLPSVDTDDLAEGSTNLYYTDTRVKTKLNAETVISGSTQIDLNHLDTDDLSEGSTNLYYTDARVKTKLNTETVVSGSSQVPMGGDISGNANDATVIKVQGVALTSAEATQISNIGSETISSTQWGYLGASNQAISTTDNVIFNDGDFTGDVQVTGNLTVLGSATEIQTSELRIADKLITVASGSVDSVASDGAGIEIAGANKSLKWDHNTTSFVLDAKVSSSVGFKGEGGELTGIDTDQVTEGSNLYYTDVRVKTKLNTETVISGSSQVNANTITNFDTNVKDKLNVEDVISGSTQIDITHLDTDDLSEGSTNLYYTDTRVKTKLNTEGVISGSSQVNANTITNFDSNVQTKIDDVGLFSGSSQVNANTITNFDANVRDYIRDIDVISGSSQVTESLDSRYLEIVGDNVFTGSSQVVLNDADKTGFDTADVVEGTNLYYTDVRVKTKLNTETVISGSSQVILNDADYTGFDTNDISEGSSNLYYTDTRVKNKLNDETVVSGSAQININHLDTDNLSEGSSNIYYTDVRVKTKLNTETVISGSSQVDIHSTDGYVANEHIDHSTISVGSGKGLTGGGTIDTNRSLTLNTGSAHFGEGVINALTGSGIISSSLFTSPSQGTSRLVNNGITTSVDLGLQTGDSPTFDGLTITSPTALGNTNFTVLMSGASGAVGKRTLATGAFYHVSSSISDGNTAVLGNAGAVKTYIDEALIEVGAGDITRVTAGAGMSGSTDSGEATVAIDTGSNHFGLGVINALTGSGIVSSSAQVNANTITNFDTNVRDYIRSLDVVSGSSQVSLGGDVTGFANDVNVGSVQGVALTSAEVTQLATIGDSTTISATQWGYLGGSNQNVKTNSDVTFASASLSNVTISGNLTVLGDATEIATSELRISDKLITVASGSTTPSQADGAGIEIAGANESITWDNGNSRFNFSDDVYASGTIKASSDIVAFASSDKELKNNITPIKNPIDKINKISGNSFDWNEDKQNIYKGKDYGVIAQEIEKVLPELVVTRESGYKAVKYEKLVSLLIEGIKELSSEVNQLKEKINKEL
jgi:hypothetical protein